MKDLTDYAKDLALCVRCGACQAQCPVYQETGREGAAARGKLVLAASLMQGDSELDAELIRDMNLCLLCGSCVSACPNQAPTDAIVAALRRQISKQQGLSTIGKGVAALTGNKMLLKGLVRGAGWLAPLLFSKIPQASGLRLRFSPASLKERSLPPLPPRDLFSLGLPGRLAGAANKPVVGFFAGCSITYLFPELAQAAIRLLRDLGCTVVLPANQGCCGMPALCSGNGPLVEQLAKANVQAFSQEPLDYVLSACASCGSTLGAAYADLFGKQAGFKAKVMDILVFLHQEGMMERLQALPQREKKVKVSYHDPCHLRNQGIAKQPRQLLRALPGIEFVEMEGAGRCCGLGGTFSATQPQLSRLIAERKVAGMAASGASLLASACPGCIMQLQDIADRATLPIRALHILELLDAALAQTRPASP